MKGKMVYTARDTGERFSEKELSQCQKEKVLLKIYPEEVRQEILGFGGAFTDTAAMALLHMNKEIQKKALDAYFDPETGLSYNMGRVPIG